MSYPTTPQDSNLTPAQNAALNVSQTPNSQLPSIQDSSASLRQKFEEWLKTQEPAAATIVEEVAPKVSSVSEAVLNDPYVQQLRAHIEALQNNKIAPRPDTVVADADPRDSEINELKKALTEIQTQLAKRATQDANPSEGPSGGDPVPYHLHLDDGSIIQNHGGNPTHIAMPDGSVRKVLHAFLSKTFEKE
jgi:hypothetical protein